MKTAYETLLSVINKDCESVFKDSNGDGYVDLSLYTFETAMKAYAKQFIDKSAELSVIDNFTSKDGNIYKSIINLKKELE